MMYTLFYQNRNNKLIDLFNIPDCVVTNVTGLGMVGKNGTFSKRADMDGEELQALTYDKRTIQISYRLIGGQIGNQAVRRFIYNLFSEKKEKRLYYIDEKLKVYTDVIVEGVDSVIWTNTPTIIVSMVASNPFFRTEEIENTVETVDGKLIFPLEITSPTSKNTLFGNIKQTSEYTIINDGHIESPLHFVLTVNSAEVANPTIHLNGIGFFGLNRTFEKGDEIHIITKRGNKTVFVYDRAEITDLFSYISSASQWLQLQTGENSFSVSSDTENADVSLKILYEKLYIGVE